MNTSHITHHTSHITSIIFAFAAFCFEANCAAPMPEPQGLAQAMATFNATGKAHLFEAAKSQIPVIEAAARVALDSIQDEATMEDLKTMWLELCRTVDSTGVRVPRVGPYIIPFESPDLSLYTIWPVTEQHYQARNFVMYNLYSNLTSMHYQIFYPFPNDTLERTRDYVRARLQDITERKYLEHDGNVHEEHEGEFVARRQAANQAKDEIRALLFGGEA